MPYDVTLKKLHPSAVAKVAAMQLQDRGILWAAEAIDRLTAHSDELENLALPLLDKEGDQIAQLLLDHGVIDTLDDMPVFTDLEVVERYKWLKSSAEQNGISPLPTEKGIKKR